MDRAVVKRDREIGRTCPAGIKRDRRADKVITPGVEAFDLIAPADLSIRTGDYSRIIHLQRGSTDVHTPLRAGKAPSLTLTRKGAVLGSAVATDPVQASPKYNDFYYSSGVLTGRKDKHP